MNPDAPLLSVRGLHVSYPSRSGFPGRRDTLQAVRNVSFDIHTGGIFGLVGESGCGKTSLARAIIRLTEPASGEVWFRGRELGRASRTTLRGIRREIQYLFQDPLSSLSPRRTIRQTLLEPLRLYRIGHPSAYGQRMEEAIATVGLPDGMLNRYPHELSGGQRQRIALARAIVAQPALIIADEPMSSLDVSVQARIISLIRKLRAEQNISFLFISHDLAVVQQLADRVAVMYLGEFVEQAASAELFSEAAHPYTRILMAAAPGSHLQQDRESVSMEPAHGARLTEAGGCVFHTHCPRVLNKCADVHPPEISLAGTNAGHGPHTVRCHLWSS